MSWNQLSFFSAAKREMNSHLVANCINLEIFVLIVRLNADSTLFFS